MSNNNLNYNKFLMIDKRLEKRTKNYQKSSTIQNIQKHREKFNLTLRKEKLFDNIMDKRLNTALFTSNIYIIK